VDNDDKAAVVNYTCIHNQSDYLVVRYCRCYCCLIYIDCWRSVMDLMV